MRLEVLTPAVPQDCHAKSRGRWIDLQSGSIRLQVRLCIRESTNDTFGSDSPSLTQRMYSGAGHDSAHTSTRVLTAMIFIPCREGLTRNPAVYSSPESCAVGAQVLLSSVLKFDKLRGTGSMDRMYTSTFFAQRKRQYPPPSSMRKGEM